MLGYQGPSGQSKGKSDTLRTAKAMKAVRRRARLEHSGGSTPDLWRAPLAQAPPCPSAGPRLTVVFLVFRTAVVVVRNVP